MNGIFTFPGKKATATRHGMTEMTFDRNWLEDKVEPLARMLAAEKMGLIKDVYGENQKYELWSQCIPEARKQLGLE